MNDRCLIVIPARLASTRLPRKLLLKETGKTVLRHTYEAAARAAVPSPPMRAITSLTIFSINWFWSMSLTRLLARLP